MGKEAVVEGEVAPLTGQVEPLAMVWAAAAVVQPVGQDRP
jgi:hypothetical protein